MQGVFFQAEDGIRDSVASRGLGDVYKRQDLNQSARKLQLKVTQDIKTWESQTSTTVAKLSS